VVTEAEDEFQSVCGKPAIGHGELNGAVFGHIPISVEEAGKQRPALRLGCSEVLSRNVLVAEYA
jgi:hypothetical protein